MDLFGVVAFGLMAVATLSSDSMEPSNSLLGKIFQKLTLDNYASEDVVLSLALIGCAIFICRTVISVYLTKRVLLFLSNRGADITSTLLLKLLTKPVTQIQKRSIQETIFALTTGVEYLSLHVLGTIMILVSDLSLLTILITGLLIIDYQTALGTVFFFSLTGLFLYNSVHKRARRFGESATAGSINSNSTISEVFMALREIHVRNRSDYYSKELKLERSQLAKSTSVLAYLPYVSKYVIETAVIVGALSVGVIQYFFGSGESGISTIAVFLAAGTRIAPAVLRVQQGILHIRSHAAKSLPTLELIAEVNDVSVQPHIVENYSFNYLGFVPSIELKNVSFSYQQGQELTIDNICLSIAPNTSVAIVGKSGAGKSTLVDVILGILEPDSGQVRLSGYSPKECIDRWPGAISYMPQQIAIFNKSIRDNIVAGYPANLATDEKIKKVLTNSFLLEYVESLHEKDGTLTGENGTQISGGQRQRLGLARSLFTSPKLLFLDEATSALDSETENKISEMLSTLKSSCTIVMIAHRLNTIKQCDKVVYMDKGKIVAQGTFDEVRILVPEFEKQVSLDDI
jgi:ABC-type multidrug transport system fused ATPase/permease subunit